jgi:putative zinc finger/helix-turn-helix YgiT family protein
MASKVGQNSEPRRRTCDECGQLAIRKVAVEQAFPFGVGEERTLLRATVPVWKCDACGEQYTDHEAEEIRHEAVCRHLKRLTPREICELREGYGLSQDEFALVTGFGSASVKRWETGALIQNEAADRYLRLLLDPAVFEKLQALQRGSDMPPRPTAHRYRTDVETRREEAQLFRLRLH